MTFPEMCDLKGIHWSSGYPRQSSDNVHMQTVPLGKASAGVRTHHSPGPRGEASASQPWVSAAVVQTPMAGGSVCLWIPQAWGALPRHVSSHCPGCHLLCVDPPPSRTVCLLALLGCVMCVWLPLCVSTPACGCTSVPKLSAFLCGPAFPGGGILLSPLSWFVCLCTPRGVCVLPFPLGVCLSYRRRVYLVSYL